MATVYSKFDSGKYPYIDSSIEHALVNPFIYSKFSNNLRIRVSDGSLININEISNIVRELLFLFDDDLQESTLLEEEYYKPEQTSKRIYDSHDFWYIIMLVNNCFTFLDYNKPNIKYVKPDAIYKLEKMINKNITETRVLKRADIIFTL